MSTQYRQLDPHEENLAVGLWTDVFETSEDEARQTFRDFRAAPQRFSQTCVAVAEDGQLLATVCYWLREVRHRDGSPVRIGHLFHVATAAAHRRQGHITRLLADTVAALRDAGCEWAILSARKEASQVYTRAGWTPISRSYWRGSWMPESLPRTHRYHVRQFDPRHEKRGWEQLAAVYAQSNARQAGSLIRTSEYWTGYASWMFGLYLDAYHAILLTASEGGLDTTIRGYSLVNYYETGFVVSEIAVDPSDPDVLMSLLNGIIAEAQRRDIPLRGHLSMANGDSARTILAQVFGQTLHSVEDIEVYGYEPFMVRPISVARSSPFVPPDGFFWPLDAY